MSPPQFKHCTYVAATSQCFQWEHCQCFQCFLVGHGGRRFVGGAQTIRGGPCPPGPIAGYGPDEYNSERILKIDQYLTKLWEKLPGPLFWITVYVSQQCSAVALSSGAALRHNAFSADCRGNGDFRCNRLIALIMPLHYFHNNINTNAQVVCNLASEHLFSNLRWPLLRRSFESAANAMRQALPKSVALFVLKI